MLPLTKPMAIGAALGAVAALPLLAAQPARAQSAQAPFTGPPPTLACDSDNFSASQIFSTATPFDCIIGDKIYSNFTLGSDTNNTLGRAIFQFSNFDPNYSIDTIGRYGPGTYSFGYTVTVFDALNTGKRIASIATSATSSAQNPNLPAGTVPDWTKTLQATTTQPETLNITASQKGAVVVFGGPTPFATPATSADFISSLTVAAFQGNFVSGTTDSIIQTQVPGETSVPGPLPILGAGAAYGFSRRLRRRIRQSA